jgi:hypothetical protein
MNEKSRWQLLGITLLSWLSVIGFDFLLHGGIVAPLYAEPHPFLLPPERAFALIPAGYLAFLILTILLLWLMMKLGINTWQDGLLFGLKIGALIWGAVVISLISISTAPLFLMVAWFVGQSIEMGLSALVIGAGLASENLRRLTAWVLLFFILAFALGILLQNL